MDDLKRIVEKIDSKLDKVDERISGIDVTLVKQNGELEHHIYRTALNEESIKLLRQQVEPLSKLHVQVNTTFKIIGMLCTGLGVIAGLGKAFLALF